MTQLLSRGLVLSLIAAGACHGSPPAGQGADTHPAPAALGASDTWGFESDEPDGPPKGFTSALTGDGRPGRWVVRAGPDAAGGRQAVAQLDDDPTDGRFALLIADGHECADFKLSVRGRPLSGEVDQVVGLVFRLRDADNYYLTRANALEGNVRLYRVKAGRREQIASWNGEITAGQWHTLAVEAQDEHLSVSWDGSRVIDTSDAIFRQPGRVGLWTKADSISEFDEVALECRDR